MRFFEWLRGRTPDVQSEAPAITINGNTVHDERDVVSASDSLETAAPARSHEPADIANFFCVIEYRDALGATTRRRVTFLRAYATDAAHYIDAVCHERQALRTFRTDRILHIIDQFGEVHDANRFLTETFDFDLDGRAFRQEHFESYEAGPEKITAHRAGILRKALHAELTLLVAIARADGTFHPEELDRIEQFVEDSADRLIQKGLLPDVFGPPEFDCLRPIIKGMRPQRNSLDGCVRSVLATDNSRIERFVRASQAVVQADGEVVAAEIDMLDWLADARATIESEWRDNAVRPNFAGMTFIFTGALERMSRNAAQAAVIGLGGMVKGTVPTYETAGKTFLVAGANSGSKVMQAMEIGIPTLTEAEFLRMIGMG